MAGNALRIPGAATLNWQSSGVIRPTGRGRHDIDFDPAFPCAFVPLVFHADSRLTPTVHDYFEITCVVSGGGVLSVEGVRYEVGPGDIIVLGDSSFHVLRAKDDAPLKCLCLFFMPSLVRAAGSLPVDAMYLEVFVERRGDDPHVVRLGRDSVRRVAREFGHIASVLDVLAPVYQCAVKNSLCAILYELAQHHRARRPARPRVRSTDARTLAPLMQWLGEHATQAIRLSDAARVACLSPSHLCRTFRRLTGSSFVEYVNRMRIDSAKEFLRAGHGARQSAIRAGFQDAHYFHRVFRRLTGMTPGQYVRRFSAE